MKVLQIVPRLRPEVCGVGDYALDLARGLRARHGLDTQFLVGNPNWTHGDVVEGFRVLPVASRSAESITRSLTAADCDVVVLHYSGYGFQKRGAPVWLARGLRQAQRPLLTMFHELFATGPITSSAFWLSPVMRVVARQLAGLSSQLLTNRDASAQWLGPRATALPICSSMGEIADPGPIAMREPWLALFGYQAMGRACYWERLTHVVKTLRPSRIVALGRAGSGVKERIQGVPCEETGILPAEAVSEWLAQCRFGYHSYNPDFMGKSGILAAFLAHGLCTVLADDAVVLPEGLKVGRELLSATNLNATSDCESTAAHGAAWYRPHNRAETADVFAKSLQGMLRAAP